MEVKTFKCDICGEVYHVEEEVVDKITVYRDVVVNGELESIRYKHICPDCGKIINRFVNKPEIAEEARKTRRAVHKLEDCLHTINNKLFFLKSFWFGAGIEQPEYYDDFTDDIVRKIDELKEYKERSHKQMITIRVLVCLLGMCIGSALAQLI